MDAKVHSLIPNIADLLLDAVVMVDVSGRIVYVNAASERIFGYAPDEMIGRTMIDLIVPEDRARTLEEAVQVMSGRLRIGFENRYIRKDGHIVHIMWSARWSEVDQLRIGVARDITERKRAEERQAATYAISEAAHHATDLAGLCAEIHRIIGKLVSVASFAVAIADARAGTLEFPYHVDPAGTASGALEETARRLCMDVVRSSRPILAAGEPPAPMVPVPGNDASWLAIPLLSRGKVLGAFVLKSHPGMSYGDKDEELLQFVSTQVATAIERMRLHHELVHAARHDELTGLPNRRLFQDRMRSALARSRRNHGRFAVLYVDLDDFKKVNDSLGHTAGDLLLQAVARRLRECVREEDTVARLGGDEFALLLEEVHVPGAAAIVAGKIRAAVSQPVDIEGCMLTVFPSIGIAIFPDDGTGMDALLKHADRAMYEAKKGKASRQR
ncbi:MAG TPA: diguanylate cyclase [Noviherbaspirillum sp.]|nr:diguanylate cyclase [Noviherbaspirillum sp.]